MGSSLIGSDGRPPSFASTRSPERAATTIDLALVEEGIEIGKRMMAEMIATYPSQRKSPEAATAAPVPEGPSAAVPAAGGGGYLNEVRSR